MDFIASYISDAMSQLQSWPNEALMFAVLVIISRIVKGTSWIPDNLELLAVIVIGAAGEILMGDVGKVTFECNNPEVRLAAIGVVIGFIAWIAHISVLRKVEDWIGSKLSSNKEPEKPTL